jgi:methionyl-tRNA synthetase
MDFPNALASIWKLISRANKYIDETAPWVLAKDESKKAALGTVMYNLMECIRMSTILLAPFMPLVPGKVAEQTGQTLEGRTWADGCTWGNVETGVKVNKKEAIFPRIDPKSLDLPKDDVKAEAPKVEAKKEPKQEAPKEETPAEAKAEITYDDFAKLDLRVVEVLECSKVEKADKLLQFKLKMGDEIRTVVSGIAKFYESPEELVGKKLVLVANLAPKKIRGIVSHGMLLSAATDDDSLLQVLQVTHEDIPSGATVC